MPHSPRWKSLTFKAQCDILRAAAPDRRGQPHPSECLVEIAHRLGLLGDREAEAMYATVLTAERALDGAKARAHALVLRKFEGDIHTIQAEAAAAAADTLVAGHVKDPVEPPQRGDQPATSTSAPTKAPALPPHLKGPLFMRPDRAKECAEVYLGTASDPASDSTYDVWTTRARVSVTFVNKLGGWTPYLLANMQSSHPPHQQALALLRLLVEYEESLQSRSTFAQP